MADQQEALERQRELYQEKNEHLERFLEPVAPYEFYREIFPEGSFERKGHFEDRKGNGIAVTVQKVEVDKATGIALQIEGDGKVPNIGISASKSFFTSATIGIQSFGSPGPLESITPSGASAIISSADV